VNLNIEQSDDLAAVVKEQAQAQGISLDLYVSRVLENTLRSARGQAHSGP
jgi:predicted HicB family RNase H-like nuclease